MDEEPNTLCNRIRKFLQSISITPTINSPQSFDELVLENQLARQRIISQNLLNTETHDKAVEEFSNFKSNRPEWLRTFNK